MSRTQQDEWFGCCLKVTGSTSDVRARLPRGPGGIRLYSVSFSGAGHVFQLPAANLLRKADQFVIYCSGGSAFDVVDARSNVLQTVTSGTLVTARVLDNSDDVGVWILSSPAASPSLGGAIAIPRKRYDVQLVGETIDFDLGTRLLAMGWDGTTAVTAWVTIAQGAMVGSSSTSWAAFRALSLPATSSLWLVNRGYILGKGGNGGGGAVAAGNGGNALHVDLPTVLSNVTKAGTDYGTIGGGGGGGQSGIANVYIVHGGAGGGGAGWRVGAGGVAIHAGAYPGNDGQPGHQTLGGAGGLGGVGPNGPGMAGAAGGALGTVGGTATSASLSPPGNPGLAILGTANVTKLYTGNIIGAEA